MDEPAALKARPHLGRLPIPYVTAIIDGRPNFRIHDNAKRKAIATRGLCQLCGHPLGAVADPLVAFVGVEGSIERGTFGEPPMHRACLEFAWEVCPWLAGRDWKHEWRAEAEGLTILPAPPETERLGIWTTTGYTTEPDPQSPTVLLWRPHDPVQPLEWRTR